MHATNAEPGAGAMSAAHGGEPTFQDWSRFVTFQPQLYFRPQDLDELKAFLASMAQGTFKGKSLRVLGGLHSCSDILVSDMILDTSGLPTTMEFSADRTLVTVSANWHLHEFLLALSEEGKSISATGGTDAQTLAGIISTNTAPASPRHTVYELLEWVEYLTIDEDGKSVVERRVTRTEAAFRAVVGSLGSIGILTRVQFRLLDELCFETIQKIVKLDEVLADLGRTSQRYDFWRIDWLPDSDEGLLWAAARVPYADPNGNYPADRAEKIMKMVFKQLERIEPSAPLLDIPMSVVYTGLALTYGETKVSGPMRNMLPVDRLAPLRVAMAEWSFDPAGLDHLMTSCRQYFRQHGWPNLPIEIELTKTDDYYMSAWNWPGLDYIIKFNFMYLTDVGGAQTTRGAILAHLQGLWAHLTRSGIYFKAHWGKINFMDFDFVQEHYEFEQFRPFMRPMFLNRYLTERLTPAS